MAEFMNTVANQIAMENRMKSAKLAAQKSMGAESALLTLSDLNQIKGLGEKSLIALFDNGITSIELLKTLSPERLEQILPSPVTRIQIGKFFESTAKARVIVKEDKKEEAKEEIE